jgi:ATP-binding cassette subfamily F protein 3
MIQITELSKSYGKKTLFDDAQLTIHQRERIGLVGRNGSGKSTLFRMLIGDEKEDKGTFVFPKNYTIGYLNQHIHFERETVLDECVRALSEEEKYDHYKAEKILFGLGFEEKDLKRLPSEFSGGYQLRINLCKTLLKNPNLLLLDEPTNYLDILSLRWLRGFIKSFKGEVLITTHDRGFLDSVVTHIVGIDEQKLIKYPGTTSHFYAKLAEEAEIRAKTRKNQEKRVKELQRFVDRFGAKATKAKQAKSKQKQIDKIELVSEKSSQTQLGFSFNYLPTSAKVLLDVKGLGFHYDRSSDARLFKNLDLVLKPGKCLGVIGANGKGKTTLLSVLAGDLEKLEGGFKAHPSLEVAYYRQTNRKDLDQDLSVAEEIAQTNPSLGLSEVRGIAGAMMFSGEDADKKIKVLSGGEQSRVLLGKILAQPCNLLLLDEPSNHLDMESVEALIDEIERFPGAVVMVTHQEDMLRRLADQCVVFSKDGAELFLGGYDEFLEKIGWEENSGEKAQRSDSSNRKDQKKARAEFIDQRSKQLRPLAKRLEQLEKKTEKQELEKNRVEVSLGTSAAVTHQGGLSMSELSKRYGELQKELDQNYEEMELLMSTIERIDSAESVEELQRAVTDFFKES